MAVGHPIGDHGRGNLSSCLTNHCHGIRHHAGVLPRGSGIDYHDHRTLQGQAEIHRGIECVEVELRRLAWADHEVRRLCYQHRGSICVRCRIDQDQIVAVASRFLEGLVQVRGVDRLHIWCGITAALRPVGEIALGVEI
ncbi:hypothetical protein RGI145_23870 (plasmid) [Roseomonas gilardii]|uniref:Uncharacterized protein n=1 Tax=Roseomonas gilardii TaxID=257708 RepID=A0A1L7ANM8_9PROT|nr:hypothetical protein RGI145_23870 [Roseomonas gilardii]